MRTRRNLKGKRFVGSIVAIGWLMTAGTGWGTPIGEEFQVNQFTTGDQEAPDLSALPNGRFIVVWESFFQPDFGYGPRILGQRLDRTDRPMGTEFVVDSTEYYSQKDPRVESWDDGRFVVQWQTRDGQEFPSDAVRARRFGPLGAPVGDDFPVFVVNELSLRIISHDVEAAADGNVLAVYSDREVLNMDPASVETRVRARQFDASNLLLDASVLQSSNDNFDVSVVGDEGSGFVAAWYLPEPPGEKIDLIGAQRFDPTGSRMGSPFPIRPDESFEDGQSIEVSLHPGGDFVAIWDGALDFVGGPLRIYSQGVGSDDQVDPAGAHLLGTGPGSSESPRLARGPDGSLLAVWAVEGAPDDEGFGIRGQYLTPEGAPAGEPFRVNTATLGDQKAPSVEASKDGKTFLVVWQTEAAPGSDTEGFGISGRRFLIPGVFSDGFESGDTSAWSDTEGF